MGTDSMFGHVLGSHFGVNGLTPMTLTVRVQCPSGYVTAVYLGRPTLKLRERSKEEYS